ncbi:MAG: hypothetical protein KC417_14785, partial [Myxococcales bacterium]|nr:hypothetical protein [Myxococcales bacterium]
SDAMTRANEGLLLLRAGKADKAKEAFLRAFADSDRTDVALLVTLGNGLRRAGAATEAREAMTLAVEARKERVSPAMLAELALAQLATEDGTAAEATLRRAIGIDAKYATAHYLLGKVLIGRGAKGEAKKSFSRSIELEPNAPFRADVERQIEALQATSGARTKPSSR